MPTRSPRTVISEDRASSATTTEARWTRTLQDWAEQATRRAGLEPTRSLHILRHTFCSHLAMRGAPAKAIQELAGHQSLAMTLRYMHLSPSARDAAIHLLDDARREERGERAENGSAANVS